MTLSATEIQKIASAVRELLESFSNFTDVVSIQRFPNGSCRDASDLLGYYLLRATSAAVWRISAERVDPYWTHDWLMVDGFIVDITADQFDEVPRQESVIVTLRSEWHANWNEKRRGLPKPTEKLWPIWNAIEAGMKKSNFPPVR